LPAARRLQRRLQRARRPWRRARRPTPFRGERLAFPEPSTPRVSIVVPVHNQSDYTWNCLRVLRRDLPAGTEVIVVDDASTDATQGVLSRCSGIRVIRNDENLGFCGSANRGAESARGDYLVFLNNDTEVQEGWIDALVDAVESEPDVGAVGAKLVLADGRLQEAGGIVWADASGWNYGLGEDPRRSRFNFRREVDYCSGAALMVRRESFERLGGFDRRFDPGFYEDVDLCFALRAEGQRTLYEPSSVVVHYGGVTFGTDRRAGVGAHGREAEHRNLGVFAQKWSDELVNHLPPGAYEGFRGGRSPAPRTVLVCDEWVPREDRDAGSTRMNWIVRELAAMECRVTVFPRDRRDRPPHTARLERAGVEVCHGRQSFPSFATERSGWYDLVIVSRPNVGVELMRDIERNFPDAAILYDTVDLQFVREQRRLELLGEATTGADVIRATELDLMRRATATIVVTEDERLAVQEASPTTRTFLLPTVHPVDDETVPSFADRSDIVFIGRFEHPPNADGVRYFVKDVLPALRRRCDAQFRVIGADPPPDLLAGPSTNTSFMGYVKDADSWIRKARVFVAPLRYGAGIKGKVGHAMSLGTPVVTTSVGAEGMGLVDGTTALIADSADAFADAVVRLYEDEGLWQRLSEAGRDHAAAAWSPAVSRRRLEAMLAGLPLLRGGHP
jgi:GT2 family glycosyltransferase